MLYLLPKIYDTINAFRNADEFNSHMYGARSPDGNTGCAVRIRTKNFMQKVITLSQYTKIQKNAVIFHLKDVC